MRGQPHLIESVDSLKARRDYTALCGKKIVDAIFGCEWDAAMMGALVLKKERVCDDCIEALVAAVAERKAVGDVERKRYLYGMLPSSEVKRGLDND